jgi:flagellar hook-length control protein FliK
MNALSMNLMLTPTPAAASPAPGAGPAARDGTEGGFAQCLEQAAGREPSAAHAAAKTRSTREPAGPDDAPTDTAEPSSPTPDGAHAARRTAKAAVHGRKAEAAPRAGPAALVTPDATVGKTPEATDAALPEDAPTAPQTDGPTELACLLPGWAPAAAAPTAPAAATGDSAEGRVVGDAALAASTPPALAAMAAEPHAGAGLPRADDVKAAAFALPPSQAIVPAKASEDTPPMPQAHVAAPVDSPGFAPALATQVRWLVRDGLQHAQLSLNPAEMGPVTVQIVLDGREARIDFRADLAATRQAIEASLPVLAAALDDSGLRLAGGGVHDGQGSRHGTGPQGWHATAQSARLGAASGDAGAASDTVAPGRLALPARGLVDLVA